MSVPEVETAPRPASSLTRDGFIGLTAGLVLGTAAGLIGVGGGEFRIPVLLYLLRLEVKTAAGVNLIVGLFTVCLAFVRRWTQQEQPWSNEDLILGGILVVASLVGSLVGARQAHRIPSRPLKWIVLGYLLIVGTWMIIEALAHLDVELLNPEGLARWLLAAAVGFVIGAISSSLGVAGGEMRIPALMYLFGYGVKEAGTISLLASIPTVGAGAVAYRRMGHIPNRALLLALLMGTGSLLGVLVGTALLPYVNRHLLKGLLGAVLLLATACLALPEFFRAIEWLFSGQHSMSAGSSELPGTTAPFPPRKRRALPWGRWGIWLAAMAVLAIAVWMLAVKAIPILQEAKEEKPPPPETAHESREFNYRLVLPNTPWTQDNQVRLRIKANLLAMRRTNPAAWFALAARDFKTRMPTDAEAIAEAVNRLSGNFKNLEWESANDGTLASRKALRVLFHGQAEEATMEGECYILTYQGISYWFTTWASLREYSHVKEEFGKIRAGFTLLKERESWREASP